MGSKIIKGMKFDAFGHFALLVLEVVRDSGPLTKRGILMQLRKRGQYHVRMNSINKVLTQYLMDQVEQTKGGVWQVRSPGSNKS